MGLMIGTMKAKFIHMLRFIERYTKLDIIYLSKSSSWLVSGQLFSTLASFLLAIVFADVLPKDTYGSYQYVISIASIFSIFALPGMTTALTRAASQGFDGSLIIATKARIRGGALGALIALIVAGYYLFAGNTTLAIGCLIIAVFLPIFDAFSNFNSYLQGKKEFRRSVTYMSAIQIVASIALAIAALLKPDFFILIFVYFAGYTILRFVFFLYVMKQIRPHQPEDPSMLSYGKHLTAMGIIGAISGNLDKILLFHYLGGTEVALYSVAIAPAGQVKSLLGLGGSLLFPQLARYSEEEIRRTMWRKFLFFGIATVASITAYIIFIPIFIRIFFPKYESIVFISQIFSLSLLLFIPEPASVYLSAKGKIKEQYYINIIMSIFQIGSITFLTATWGLMGLIIAQILTRWLGGFLNFFYYYFPLTSMR
jgi:O-antigen/teichoic acid export membrane protein